MLDFAKPIRFDLAEASLNDICRASAAAAWAGDAEVDMLLDLDPQLPAVVTDAERLRTALVNILTNARHAVEAAADAAPAGVPGERRIGIGKAAAPGALAARAVTLRTRHEQRRISVTISDRGIGITPEDMAHIFDPYFTTAAPAPASACRSPRTSSKGSAARSR